MTFRWECEHSKITLHVSPEKTPVLYCAATIVTPGMRNKGSNQHRPVTSDNQGWINAKKKDKSTECTCFWRQTIGVNGDLKIDGWAVSSIHRRIRLKSRQLYLSGTSHSTPCLSHREPSYIRSGLTGWVFKFFQFFLFAEFLHISLAHKPPEAVYTLFQELGESKESVPSSS